MIHSTGNLQILKFRSGQIFTENDTLACEEPLEILLEFGSITDRTTKPISVTMRTPGNDEALALGFLFTEGIIKDGSEVESVSAPVENNIVISLTENIEPSLKKLDRNFYTTSSCGVCGKTSIDAVKITIPKFSAGNDFIVPLHVLHSLPAKLRATQPVFDQTGGLHASALFDLQGNLLFAKEDVGRHNALDKVIGIALKKNLIPLSEHILLLSGRASFELIQKAAMAGIRMVAAVGAPSTLAAKLATDCGVTLLGFLSEKRFNIYSNETRVEVSETSKKETSCTDNTGNR